MAYTLLDLQTSVQDDLKDSSFNATRIMRYLNYGQLAIFNMHLFKFCEKSVSGALTIGEHTYEQQTDHQATIGGVLVDPDDSNTRCVLTAKNYMPHRIFFELYPDPENETSGLPSCWTEYGDQVFFNCPVDKAYTLRQRYFRVPTSMTVSASVPDVPEAFRELLELYANYRGEKYRGNHDVAATYKQDFEDGLENMTIRFSGVTEVGLPQVVSFRSRVDV